MNMKYYNASNHFSAPLKREPKPYSPYTRTAETAMPQKPPPQAESFEPQPPLRTPELPIAPVPRKAPPAKTPAKTELRLSSMKADDLLLLGIIALFVWNSCDDALLLFILGYLFLIGLQ